MRHKMSVQRGAEGAEVNQPSSAALAGQEQAAGLGAAAEDVLWARVGGLFSRILQAELHLRLLWLLILVSFFLRVLWLARPEGALIFDAKYYVNAARVIAG